MIDPVEFKIIDLDSNKEYSIESDEYLFQVAEHMAEFIFKKNGKVPKKLKIIGPNSSKIFEIQNKTLIVKEIIFLADEIKE